ncbi:ATP-dependent helicase HrpB [Paenibacillus lemnae]|uniref:ATP-dependent helicase HrpB n=1 Tax=Paenibacillus lemnae TaxID=1330551 RepID=A0A848M7N2_PAELE|nr:ATP-dependent helicase HrpB [Paenibacillus lemnae]NMO96279.1 ATP-dependent helicase HrpB [Paenibacillus lemnae]
MDNNKNELPIEQILPQLIDHFRTENNAALIAEPGAGKTTRVPLALMDEDWLAGQKIIMLEPRRLAARSAAAYMARALGEKVGERVGYRVRLDTKVSSSTVIEVVTEGILTRMLQHDPSLPRVGMIIFDEFHERSIHADTGLALALESQSVLRDDLKVLVMSATLEGEPVSELLGGAAVLSCTGRSYPVTTVYAPPLPGQALEQAAAASVMTALHDCSGDILVFLPGMREIRRTHEALRNLPLSSDVVLRELHGQLSQEQQDLAVQTDSNGLRKVVLSTSIAETSLTIQGIGAVVDSGYTRVEEYSYRTGLPLLVTHRVSKAAADQRRGRAGRLAAGTCYRLWSVEEHARLRPAAVPEILRTDLLPLALELAVWGVKDPGQLSWMDEPPSHAVQHGRGILSLMGALNTTSGAAEHGRRMAELSIHPRLAHMLILGKSLNIGALACKLAALLQDREALHDAGGAGDHDIVTTLETMNIRHQSHARISAEAGILMKKLGVEEDQRNDLESAGILLAFAYPDRIARKRGNGSFLLRSGRGIMFKTAVPLSRCEYIVAVGVDDRGADGIIQVAAELNSLEMEQHFSSDIKEIKKVTWDSEGGRVKSVIQKMLGEIMVSEKQDPRPNDDDVAAAVIEGIRREGLKLLGWSKQSMQWRQRVAFMGFQHDEWPDFSDTALLNSLEEWLLPYLAGVRSRQELKALHAGELIAHRLSWEQRQQLELEAPTRLEVPSGSRIPIRYDDPAAPAVEVRLQEVFGLDRTPRIGGGSVPVTFHLLSPARRTVQITSDLDSFWRGAYFEIKKDLKGRYPKHYWPDDPFNATPTNRVKPKLK